jgi:disulfide bond formation protein DsbB
MNSNKLLLNGILVFSILSLSIAYFIQYVLGHKPCNLCIIERIPYIAAIILISLVFILNRYQKIISSLILIFFIFGAVVSFYHFGIEQGFFSESLICELTNNNPLNKEELLNQLKKAEIVSCKDVTFRFLGLSLATINTIISLALSGIMFRVIKNYGKN